jgi:hypothetical protein
LNFKRNPTTHKKAGHTIFVNSPQLEFLVRIVAIDLKGLVWFIMVSGKVLCLCFRSFRFTFFRIPNSSLHFPNVCTRGHTNSLHTVGLSVQLSYASLFSGELVLSKQLLQRESEHNRIIIKYIVLQNSLSRNGHIYFVLSGQKSSVRRLFSNHFEVKLVHVCMLNLVVSSCVIGIRCGPNCPTDDARRISRPINFLLVAAEAKIR